jgi:hypothetical protein
MTLGLATSDLNDPTYNSFGLIGGLNAVDFDAANPVHATTLAGVVTIDNGGFNSPVPEPGTISLLGPRTAGRRSPVPEAFEVAPLSVSRDSEGRRSLAAAFFSAVAAFKQPHVRSSLLTSPLVPLRFLHMLDATVISMVGRKAT